MNTELTNIKDFIRKNLDPCYYETAEEMMLINPLCGVVKKFTDDFKAEEKRIVKEKEAIRLRDLELQRRFNELQERESEVEEESKEAQEKLTKVEKRSWDLLEQERQLNEKIANLSKAKCADYHDILKRFIEVRGIVQQYFNVDIDRRTNKRDIVYARQMAMYYARKLTKLSLTDIGIRIANRDHATVMHSVKVINNLSRYPETAKHLKELNQIFGING